jgi:hypothetical protein
VTRNMVGAIGDHRVIGTPLDELDHPLTITR